MTTHPSTAPGRPRAGPGRHEPLAAYFVVYGVLMLLLVATVLAAFLEAGPLAIVIALLIAIIKSVLVVLYFMHVRLSSPLVKLFVVAGIFWLGILFVLTFSDYLTREWIPMSQGWLDNPAAR